jgi:E3 ubiquitin-protein ligase UBR4
MKVDFGDVEIKNFLYRYILYESFAFVVGASVDPGGVTMVDFIKVFVKSKESFGWPEEPDEFLDSQTQKSLTSSGGMAMGETEVVPSVAPLPLTSADRLLGSALEVLDGAFAACPMEEKVPFLSYYV